MVKKVIFVFLLSLISGFVFFKNLDLIPTTDSQRYTILARNLVERHSYSLGGKPELIFPPGYSILISPLVLFGFDNPTAVALLMAVSMFVLGYALFRVSTLVMNEAWSAFFSLLILVNGNILNLAVVGGIEIVWLAVLAISLEILRHKRRTSYLVSGMLFGLAYLLKPETVGILLIGLILYLFTKDKNFQKIFTIIIGFVLIASPYIWFFYRHTGKITFSGKIAVLSWSKFVEEPNLSRESLIYPLFPDGVVGPDLKHFSVSDIDWPKRVRVNIAESVLSLYQLLLPFKIVISVLTVLILLNRKKLKAIVISLILIAPLSGSVLFHIEARYYILAMVLVIFWIFDLSLETLSQSKFIKYLGLVGFLSIAIMTYYSYWPMNHDLPINKAEKSKIISSMGKIPKSNLILSRKPYYSFYLNCDYYPLPYLSESSLGYMSNYLNQFKDPNVVLDSYSTNLGLTNDYFRRQIGSRIKVLDLN